MASPAWLDVMKQTGLDDMILLSQVNNDQIRDNLRERFNSGVIYTNISDVLISMNPYRWIDGIYEDSILREYVGRARIEMPPHIYSIAEQSFRNMLNEKTHQCVIISGESGAGKTEAAKKIMHYIAEVTGGGAGSRLEHVKTIVLETNPLLEAFGNAKTLRNNNSSRFGKYFELQFTWQGDPDGGVITNYLLEKSRVVYQIPGERNFHVFYQLCKGASPQEQQNYGLSAPSGFAYLVAGQTTDVDGIDDVAEYHDMRKAMNLIGITDAEQQNILRCLAAIMWLGNLEFQEQGTDAKVVSHDVLNFIASLLSVSLQMVQDALEIRTMETQRGAGRAGSSYRVPFNYVQAIANRDALAKAIYSKLFDWLVLRLNKALVAQKPDLWIGVLDIYGFEVFDKNSFEQLCINYVNEKLQQIFIQYTLKQEQAEYVAEGIQWTPIQYFDNEVVCSVLENTKPPGVFPLMDDVSKSVHAMDESGTDKALASRLQTISHNHFAHRHNHFVIKHYAGDVTYEILGMVEKNKDVLGQDLIDLSKASENPFIADLFPEEGTVEKGGRKAAPSTAGYKIRTSANALVKTLSQCQPHYVRCLKPNDAKRSDWFDDHRVLHQIQYLGLLDNVKVRRSGFAYRTTYQKFLDRYYLISKKTSYAARLTWKGDARSGVESILRDAPIATTEWQMGKTKVFLRSPETLFLFEDLRVNYYHNIASRIKSAWHLYKNFQDIAATRIKTAFRCHKEYRHEQCSIIQRAYRQARAAGAGGDLKAKIDPILAGKKERNRLSMLSTRKFFGDYLEMRTQNELRGAMAEGSNEQVLFSTKSICIVNNKPQPRWVVVTVAHVYTIMMTEKKGVKNYLLDRKIPLNVITSCEMSPNYDDYLVIHATEPNWDLVVQSDLKTELAAWLNEKAAVAGKINFQAEIQYRKKKSSKAKLRFMPNEKHKLAAQNPFFKKGKVFVSLNKGLAPGTQPNRPRYKMTGPARQRREKMKQMAGNTGGLTGSLKGTTRVDGAGHKNAVVIAGLTDHADRQGGPERMDGGGAASPKGAGRAKGAGPTGPAAGPAGAKAGQQKGAGGGAQPGGQKAGGAASPAAQKGGAARALPKAAAPKAAGESAVAQYDYPGTNEGELAFSAGEQLTIVNKPDPGWWEAVNGSGKKGWIPANYVTLQ